LFAEDFHGNLHGIEDFYICVNFSKGDRLTENITRRARRLRILSGMAIGALIVGGAPFAQTTPPPPTLAGTLPLAIPAHSTQTPEAARPFFDSFSWQSFVALMWPVNPSQRGVPLNPTDPAALTKAGNNYSTVWGSYLTDTALFPGGTQRPIAWNQTQPSTLCPNLPAGGKVMTRISEAGSLLSDLNQAFSFPLVDQNNNYIYYEIAYDQAQYDFVRGADADPASWLYLARNLAQAEMKAPIAMPIGSAAPAAPGAMMLKAGWKQLTVQDDASRYYWINAAIYDPTATPPVCHSAKLGLIALHIARKVAPFPQWVWSTLEQVDNVPPDKGSPPHAPLTLNNGTATPPTDQGWANRPKDKGPVPPGQRSPAQVTRFNPIPTTPAGNGTTDLNTRWQAALAGTPLAYYQLVMTQWPSMPVAQDGFQTVEAGGLYPGGAGQPFPVAGAINAAIETFFQSQRDAAGAGGNSCMQCHYTAGQADFSWSLTLRSY
jgi:hypothetical protein